jgi:hypothetical protein
MIDKRKNYYLTIDTETANTLDDPLVYDIGGAIHDKKGNIYETFSFLIYDIFCLEKELMQSAYYADKLPLYTEKIQNQEIKFINFFTAKKHIAKLSKEYNIKAIIAHNMFFDYRAVSTTQRYITKSKYRHFLPYGIPLYCTLNMARSTVLKQKSYISWAKEYGYTTKTGKPRATAEILYKYLSGQNDFIEEHTGLADVLIEIQIFAWIMRQNKKTNKLAFRPR